MSADLLFKDDIFISFLDDAVDCLINSESVTDVSFHMQRMCYSDKFQMYLAETRENKGKKDIFYKIVRNAFAPGYQRSGIWNHSIVKPFGYSGDYEILEHLYEYKIHQNTHPSNFVLDQYVHQLNLINAVRHRKDILVHLLKELREKGARSFCSVGSGSAREIFEAADIMRGAQVELVDFDPRSLAFAKQRLESLELQIDTVVQDGRKLRLDKSYDVIYSFGFFDYLQDRFLDAVISELKNRLEPAGHIIYSLKNIERYNAWFYDLFCDWRFYRRTAEQADAVAARNGLTIESRIPTENHAAIVYVCKIADQ